jgi:plastocyanin
MHMRRLLIALTAALGSAGFGLLPASAAPVHTPKTVQIVGTQTFSPDEFFSITFRFTPRRIAVHTGDAVTWNNQTTDVHTVSVVSRDQVPRTIDQVNNCPVCNELIAAHTPNGPPPQGQPVLVLDGFKAANPPAKFAGPGDSALIPPPGLGLPTSVTGTITAPAGTTLNYLCAFHPWMQATIRVLGEADNDQ